MIIKCGATARGPHRALVLPSRPVTLALLLGALAATGGAPPALTAPDDAREWARAEGSAPAMTRAETLLFANDPTGALDVLLTAEVPRTDPRRLRLELDAVVDGGHERLAEARAAELLDHEGWGVHARRQMQWLEDATTQRAIVRVALIMFAMCLATLCLGGSRELLRPSVETLVFLAALVASALVIRTGSPVWATLLVLPSLATLALVHAAAAATRRTQATVRGRVLAAVLVTLGALGAFVALAAQLGPQGILGLVAR